MHQCKSPAHDLVSIVTSILFSMHGRRPEASRAGRNDPQVICPNTSDQQDFVLAHQLASRAGTSTRQRLSDNGFLNFSAGSTPSTSSGARPFLVAAGAPGKSSNRLSYAASRFEN